MQSCSLLYPDIGWLYRRPQTDIFVEIVNLQTSKTILAYFASVDLYPMRLKLPGFLDIKDIQIILSCSFSRYLQVDQNPVMLTDDSNHVIKLTLKRQVLV